LGNHPFLNILINQSEFILPFEDEYCYKFKKNKNILNENKSANENLLNLFYKVFLEGNQNLLSR